jgi:hypothetical protein
MNPEIDAQRWDRDSPGTEKGSQAEPECAKGRIESDRPDECLHYAQVALPPKRFCLLRSARFRANITTATIP